MVLLKSSSFAKVDSSKENGGVRAEGRQERKLQEASAACQEGRNKVESRKKEVSEEGQGAKRGWKEGQ